MGKSDQLSSTERLLRVIREGDKGEESEAPQGATGRVSKNPGDAASRKKSPSFRLHKSSTIGIDIDSEAVRIVALSPEGSAWRIRHFWKLPLNTPQESSDFPSHLKKLLDESLGHSGGGNLWAFLPSSIVEIVHLRIPKVAKKDIPNAVFWSLKREKGLNERERSFDFELEGEVVDKGIPKTAVVAVTFPKEAELKIKSLFSRIGYPIKGLAAPPFAIQNLFSTGWMAEGARTVSVLDIQDQGSRIDIFQDGRLVLSRDIKTGIGSMVDAFVSEFHEYRARTPKTEGEGEAPEAGGQLLLTATQSKQMLLKAMGHPRGKLSVEVEQEASGNELFELGLPALQRLARQIERTFTYNTQTMNQEPVDTMLLTGEMAVSPKLQNYLADQLGIKVEALDCFARKSPVLEQTTAPSDPLERVAFTPVVGLALSEAGGSPNLLYTYQDKIKQQKAVTLQRIILGITFACALVLGGVFLWQTQIASSKQKELAEIEKELSGFKPQVSEQMLYRLSAQISDSQEELRKYSKRYVGLAALTEVIRLTPEGIKLHKVTTELAGQAGKGKSTLVLEGIVLGEKSEFETALASYLVKLRGTPLFEDPAVHNRSVKVYSGIGEVLHFIVYINVV